MTTAAAKTAERIVHALLFELFAILLLTPIAALALDKPLLSVGSLALVLSAIAMSWNLAYNLLVDRYVQVRRIDWRWRHRLLHGLVFELVLIGICVPLVAWWLAISWWQALLLDIAFFVIILPYTMVFNWCFDRCWHQLMSRTLSH